MRTKGYSRWSRLVSTACGFVEIMVLCVNAKKTTYTHPVVSVVVELRPWCTHSTFGKEEDVWTQLTVVLSVYNVFWWSLSYHALLWLRPPVACRKDRLDKILLAAVTAASERNEYQAVIFYHAVAEVISFYKQVTTFLLRFLLFLFVSVESNKHFLKKKSSLDITTHSIYICDTWILC